MWSNSEAAIEPSSYKTVTLYFLTATCRSYFFSKVTCPNYPRGHVTSFRRRYDVYTASYRLRIDVETILSFSEYVTLQNNILCQKYLGYLGYLGFSGAEQLLCRKKFGEHLFCILHFEYNAFQRLLLVDTTNIQIY